jgi:hypothetical protein
MGSSGGASSGKVDYPDYQKNMHFALLSNTGADSLNFSAFDLLNEATSSNPYTGVIAYHGDGLIGAVPSTVASCLSAALGMIPEEPYNRWSSALALAATKHDSTFEELTDRVEQDITEKQSGLLSAQASLVVDHLKTGSAYSSAAVFSRGFEYSTWAQPIATRALQEQEKAMLQRNINVMQDALDLVGFENNFIKISRGVYATAIEMTKLQILNEREYYPQVEDILEQTSKWALTQYQVFGNGVAAIHGGIPIKYTPETSAMMTLASAGSVTGGMSRGQAALSGAAAGASIGACFGGVGAIPGAIIGGIVGFVSSMF